MGKKSNKKNKKLVIKFDEKDREAFLRNQGKKYFFNNCIIYFLIKKKKLF